MQSHYTFGTAALTTIAPWRPLRGTMLDGLGEEDALVGGAVDLHAHNQRAVAVLRIACRGKKCTMKIREKVCGVTNKQVFA